MASPAQSTLRRELRRGARIVWRFACVAVVLVLILVAVPILYWIILALIGRLGGRR